MKLRFKQECSDKYTNTLYEVGSVHEFEDERAKEILNTGYAELIEEKTTPIEPFDEEPSKEEDTKTVEERLDEGEVINLYELSRDELQKLAKEKGVAIRGTKEEIIERLLSN